MRCQMDRLTIGEAEVLAFRLGTKMPEVSNAALQLADTMRENKRLRELLQELHESMSMEAGYHYSDGETAQEIAKLLSNKDTGHE